MICLTPGCGREVTHRYHQNPTCQGCRDAAEQSLAQNRGFEYAAQIPSMGPPPMVHHGQQSSPCYSIPSIPAVSHRPNAFTAKLQRIQSIQRPSFGPPLVPVFGTCHSPMLNQYQWDGYKWLNQQVPIQQPVHVPSQHPRSSYEQSSDRYGAHYPDDNFTQPMETHWQSQRSTSIQSTPFQQSGGTSPAWTTTPTEPSKHSEGCHDNSSWGGYGSEFQQRFQVPSLQNAQLSYDGPQQHQHIQAASRKLVWPDEIRRREYPAFNQHELPSRKLVWPDGREYRQYPAFNQHELPPPVHQHIKSEPVEKPWISASANQSFAAPSRQDAGHYPVFNTPQWVPNSEPPGLAYIDPISGLPSQYGQQPNLQANFQGGGLPSHAVGTTGSGYPSRKSSTASRGSIARAPTSFKVSSSKLSKDQRRGVSRKDWKGDRTALLSPRAKTLDEDTKPVVCARCVRSAKNHWAAICENPTETQGTWAGHRSQPCASCTTRSLGHFEYQCGFRIQSV